MSNIEFLGQKAKLAFKKIAISTGKERNSALKEIARALIDNKSSIISANKIDLLKGKQNGLTESFLDRLTLNEDRIQAMVDGISQIISFADPIGKVLDGHITSDGLQINKISVPLGVIGIIYESRPNVTVDAAVLCLKAGNSVILRGGKESINSNLCLCNIMRDAITKSGLPSDCIQLIDDTSRESAMELMQLTEYLDVLIPRGGKGLIRSVAKNSRVPVIKTGEGNCHIYIDKFADIQMAANIVYNAKTSRTSVCNAVETILVHKDIADIALPVIKDKLVLKNVELRCCDKAFNIIGSCAVKASAEDWETEFLDYILAIKVVDSINEAISHIDKYSTGHSEAIITNDYARARRFTSEVDSAAVYVNASTRFTDGGQFGMGAEIGISTQKLHARGPMGLEQLTSTKFIVNGNGHVR